LFYRERFLGIWTLAWVFIVLKSLLDPYVFNVANSISTIFVFQALGVLCALFLAWGTCEFVNKRLPSLWIHLAVVLTILSNIGVQLNWPLVLLAVPNVLLYGSIYIYTGLILLRHLETQGLGKRIACWTFIAMGFHQFDFPLFRPTEMAAWGYLFDAYLRLIMGVGFLLTFFEKTRYDLSKQKEQYRLLTENAKDVIFRYRMKPSAHFEYISPAAQEITGYSPEDFYNDPGLLLRIVHPEDRGNLYGFNPEVTSNDTPQVYRILTKSSKEIWVEEHFTSIADKEKNIVAIEGIVRDITSRKNFEQELFRLDRLNIVGQMAANIGHEIRNPLTTVRGYIQILSRKKELSSHRDNFSIILEELDRANSLISEYLSLSKNRLTDRKPNNLNSIITSLYPLIQADAASSNHLVRLDLQEIPNLYLDEKEIRQLILNLSRNGLEAMAPGKVLTIRTCKNEGTVILIVEDQGSGIPMEVRDKLGIPFYSTKESGTGLGLAICYSIANRHKAKIDVHTGPSGTSFSIHFSSIEHQTT